MPPEQWDDPVLIVGAAPSGLVSSLALARYGVEHVLVERHQGTAHTARAHIVNQCTSRSCVTWASRTAFTPSRRRTSSRATTSG
jgi:2-polyprenyl-6-methoxyphenol hydroxylase-like FAD-dependent oxidoreductase